MNSDAFIYRGSSMLGTLRPGDRVITDHSLFESLQPGDLVVYRNPGYPSQQTLHRVIRKADDFILTQGDNVQKADDYRVTPNLFIGKVGIIERSGKALRVRGGNLGVMRAKILHLHRRIRLLLSPFSHSVYEYLGRTVIRWCRWQPVISTIRLSNGPETIIKYVRDGKTVAQWNQETGLWDYRKPYDLILNRPE